jgi:hypothetical protein
MQSSYPTRSILKAKISTQIIPPLFALHVDPFFVFILIAHLGVEYLARGGGRKIIYPWAPQKSSFVAVRIFPKAHF